MATVSAARDAASSIQQMIEPWARACMDRDWDAVLEMCNEDIVFMPPGSPLVTGEALRPWLESFPEILAFTWGVSWLEEAGDVGWLRGTVNQTLSIDGQRVEFNGKYADVIRRGADGRWRFSLIIWNADEG